MRVITRTTLITFYEKDADARSALEEWYEKTKNADWTCFADVKKTFNSVDNVGNQRYVFNIRGNKYRLVAIIVFQVKQVYIRYIGKHDEYNKIDCRNI